MLNLIIKECPENTKRTVKLTEKRGNISVYPSIQKKWDSNSIKVKISAINNSLDYKWLNKGLDDMLTVRLYIKVTRGSNLGNEEPKGIVRDKTWGKVKRPHVGVR